MRYRRHLRDLADAVAREAASRPSDVHALPWRAAVLAKVEVHHLGVMVLLEDLAVEVVMAAVAVLRAAQAIHQAQTHLKVIMVVPGVVLVLLILEVEVDAPVQLVAMVCLIPVLLEQVVLALLIQLQDQQ